MRRRLARRVKESVAAWASLVVERSGRDGRTIDRLPTGQAVDSAPRTPDPGFEIANKARIDWTIHLHAQIHQYLRLAATLQQIGIAAVVTSTGFAFQFPAIRPTLFVLGPYFIGLLILAFGSYLREVFVAAGFIEHYETELARSLGSQVLIMERVLGASPPNKFGALLSDTSLFVLFVVSLAASVRFSLQEGAWAAVINCALLAILLTTVIVSFIELRRARAHVRTAAAAFQRTPPDSPDRPDQHQGNAPARDDRRHEQVEGRVPVSEP